MKKVMSIFAVLCLLFLCSCGDKTTQNLPDDALQTESYTYEQEQQISEYIKTELSQYGFKYDVSVSETDGKIRISLHLKRTPSGAKEAFSDTVEWSMPIIQKTKENFTFELDCFEIAFFLYKGSLKENADGMIVYRTEDLQTGLLLYGTDVPVLSKQNVSYERVRECLID